MLTPAYIWNEKPKIPKAQTTVQCIVLRCTNVSVHNILRSIYKLNIKLKGTLQPKHATALLDIDNFQPDVKLFWKIGMN